MSATLTQSELRNVWECLTDGVLGMEGFWDHAPEEVANWDDFVEWRARRIANVKACIAQVFEMAQQAD